MLKPLLIVSLAGVIAFPALAQPAGGPPRKKRDKPPVKVDYSKLPVASDQKDITYAAQIKGIFDASCTRCHGAEKPKGRLRLDSLEGVLKGSEHGKVAVPGDAKGSSLLVNAARIGDPDAYMPPPNNKAGIQPLTKEQVALIRAWIEQGAK